ncbi:rhodanese-like domain-containing protein [Polaribacter sp. Hel1_85]|uniref:rhodanese-like domain-containing protein n=1 Tax=Polaribacter sp. Hel1_85 TaxID=1250005 RepID=UPI00052C6F54|nr:rhodanese-like domain-containing protein [Polaribacter sp. Hel1_85]KGL62353.1 rhodanese-like domain protein [Polaribacter sp. Hel1_85]
MKELEKTKRISIASTLFILVVLIGLLTYKRPKNTYALNTKSTLENLSNNNYFASLNEVSNKDYVLVDIRSAYEFEKGHLENAINIHTPDFLNEDNLSIFKEIKETNKTVILYGKNPEEVNLPFLLLYQLGYDNMKLLTVKLDYYQNKLITKNCDVEISKADVAAFINESVKKQADAMKKANIKITTKPKTTTTPKKVIPIRKKKKMPTEGGC